jgi:Arc/MetJ-type ribon-helix-helix transcriptional regulator
MKVMDKRIILNLPSSLYEDIQRIAKKHYLSVSGFIRQSVLEKMKDEFTSDEASLIEEGKKSFRAGKGVNWRDVKRG